MTNRQLGGAISKKITESDIRELLAKKHSNQSPIDLIPRNSSSTVQLDVLYDGLEIELVNSNRVLRADVIPDDKVRFKGKEYTLEQFHFHSPSEHTLDGRRFDMEVHLVHRSLDGEILVIGCFFTIGEENKFLNQFWSLIPPENNMRAEVEGTVRMAPLLVLDEGYCHYTGSLTTPPYSTGVKWIVLNKIQEISRQQYSHYRSIFPEDTNRDIQPNWNRTVEFVK